MKGCLGRCLVEIKRNTPISRFAKPTRSLRVMKHVACRVSEQFGSGAFSFGQESRCHSQAAHFVLNTKTS